MANISSGSESTYTVLVTGVNSGLGFGICCRLIDEFLALRPQSQKLHLITTTRDRAKSDTTLIRLRTHLQKTFRQADKKQPGISKLLEPRVSFQGELLDLTQLQSIRRLAQKLLQQDIRINVLVHNAGINSIIGGPVWSKVVHQFFTDPIDIFTYPTFTLGRMNWKAPPQFARATSDDDSKLEPEPGLGMVFTSNIFGPYLLTHQLMPLLTGGNVPSRIIWVGTTNAFPHTFRLEDFQGLHTPHAYESSKRVMDIMFLTYGLPSVEPWVSQWCFNTASTAPERSSPSQHPKIYIAHPGILQTNIVALPPILQWLTRIVMLFFRAVLGNFWQTVYPYTAAVSMVWLALASQSMLDAMEADEGRSKWGSAVDRSGNERCERTEVEGWGVGGVIGDAAPAGKRRLGTWKGLRTTTNEVREEFEAAGRDAWREIERMRVDWEERLGWTQDTAESQRRNGNGLTMHNT